MAKQKKQTRKEMIEFLSKHCRYHTMNSWNNATSYARNVKIYNLGLTREQENKAYEIIYAEGAFDEINELMREFDAVHGYEYQMAFNGRSGGYVVLIPGGKRPSGYQSYCPRCGQRNYAKVLPATSTAQETIQNYVRSHSSWTDEVYLTQEEITKLGLPNEEVLEIIRLTKQELRKSDVKYTSDNICGRCGAPGRLNYSTPHMQVYTQPGKGIDMDADFEEWDDYCLQSRYMQVKEFDSTVDECIEAFKAMCNSCKAVEKTIMVPKTVTVLECAGASAT
ncbi:MAG: hypothetical protein WCE94_15390 [Candidatus Methanoperedens sp.]